MKTDGTVRGLEFNVLCRLISPVPSNTNLEILYDEGAQNFVEIVDGRVIKRGFVIGIGMPNRRKRGGDQVQDGNTATHERNVIVLNTTWSEFRAEDLVTSG